jgi:hypothetical protein
MRRFWLSGCRLVIGYTSVLLVVLLSAPSNVWADCGSPNTCEEAGWTLCDELTAYCSCMDVENWVAPCYLCQSTLIWYIRMNLMSMPPAGSQCNVECGQAVIGNCLWA